MNYYLYDEGHCMDKKKAFFQNIFFCNTNDDRIVIFGQTVSKGWIAEIT